MHMFSRPRRALWGDVRFLIGVVLVVASVAGVWLVVSSAGATTPVLRADRTIVRGEVLVSDDFQAVEVGLGAMTTAYLAPSDLRAGQVASRTIQAGELLPTSAAVEADETRSTTLVIESSTGIPDDVTAGTVVELWHAPPLDDGRTHDVPRVLAADVVVSSVSREEGVLAGEGSSAEVVIDRADVADVLAAMTGGSALSVVPVGPRS